MSLLKENKNIKKQKNRIDRWSSNVQRKNRKKKIIKILTDIN